MLRRQNPDDIQAGIRAIRDQEPKAAWAVAPQKSGQDSFLEIRRSEIPAAPRRVLVDLGLAQIEWTIDAESDAGRIGAGRQNQIEAGAPGSHKA